MKKTALIVDDSRLACKIMANMLDSLNIESTSVFSAEDALDFLQHTLPDILFLDHSMPGMSGLETIKLIKDNPRTATVPVLMYTAKEGEVYVGQARALGAVDVLPKGMEKDHLLKSLTKLGLISLDAEVVVNEPKKSDKFVDRRQQAKQTTDLPTQENEPKWKQFWLAHIEPFLKRQNSQQSDEIRYTSRRQTASLTREIHKTLEQFEHALIARLETHDELKLIDLKIEKNKDKKVYFVIVAVLSALLAGIYWQVSNLNNISEQLASVQKQQQNLNNKIKASLVRLEQQVENYNTPGAIALVPTVSKIQTVSLVDDFSITIAENLLLSQQNGNEYFGVSPTGYQFVVNLQGEVGLPISTQYYMTEDCTGEVFIASENGIVYRGSSGELWYVDKMAQALDLRVVSTQVKNDSCRLSNGKVFQLRLLERDYNMSTGIDETQTLSLKYEN